jgi:hypothetical protein
MLGLVRSAAEEDPRLKRKAEFMARHRRDYGYGARLDRLRSTHFSRLRGIPPPHIHALRFLHSAACCGRSHGRHAVRGGGAGSVYLDHAGATLYSEQQLRAVTEHLAQTLYGNPRTPHLLFMRCRSRLLPAHVRSPNLTWSTRARVCVCVWRE